MSTMMKQTKLTQNAFLLSLVGLILFLGCKGVRSPNQSTQITENQLTVTGEWLLKTVNNQSPSNINIKSWSIEFSDKQKWTYSGEMIGQYAGMTLQGSGTWTINGGLLNYTAGNNKGQTRIRIEGNMLILSPDPVLMSNGKDPVTTSYERVRK